MSVATQLVAPECDPDFDYGDIADRRARLRAVPTELPGRPAGPAVADPVRHHPAGPTVRRAVAPVAVLLAPEPDQAPVRLTRRGVVVLALLVAAVGAVLVWVAMLSAPSGAAPAGAAPAASAAVVTVEAGDTLWSIASRVAPGVDPRAEVEHLRRLNSLDSVALVPGQQLHVR